MLSLAQSHVMSLQPYFPGRSIENDRSILSWAKLANNENCLGPSPLALEAILKAMKDSHGYPNATRMLMIEKICEHLNDFGVTKENVALGNGSSELIVNLVRSLLSPDEALLYSWPTFIMYPLAAQVHDRKFIAVPLKSDMSYDVDHMLEKIIDRRERPVKLVILANPNNPTGLYLNHHELRYLLTNVPDDVVMIIDEAYFEYVRKENYPNGLEYAMNRPRTLVLRTMSKIYGLAGLRLGYAVGDKQVIDLLCRIRDPFNVNMLVQHASMAALDDHLHVQASLDHNLEMKPQLVLGLLGLGLRCVDGVGNFVMAQRTELMRPMRDICNDMLKSGVMVRHLSSFGLDEWMRISVGTSREIAQLFSALEKVI